jgi:hypothetical protein
MNFPTHFHDLWRCKRDSFFNRVLRNDYAQGSTRSACGSIFTWPNRDRSVAVGGCIYSHNTNHTQAIDQPRMSVTAQLEKAATAIHRRHRTDSFIGYFQSSSNTCDNIDRLEKRYTPRRINRGHDLAHYIDAFARAHARRLGICTHLIFGFPGESRGEMVESADLFNRLGIAAGTLHNLPGLKNIVFEDYYLAGSEPLLSQTEDVARVVDFFERLHAEIFINRLSAAAHRAITVVPARSVNKRSMHNAIQREPIGRDGWQCGLYTKPEFRTSLPGISSEGAEL